MYIFLTECTQFTTDESLFTHFTASITMCLVVAQRELCPLMMGLSPLLLIELT